jgi:NADH:ubiquinone oxidoreductase subunit K
MLRCVRERFRPSSLSQLLVARSLSPYDVIIYLFCTELLLYSKDVTFVSIESSYVYDLVLAHLVIMFASGSWCPEIQV